MRLLGIFGCLCLLHGGAVRASGADAFAAMTNGQAIAQVVCVTCHRFPEPSLLGRSAWLQGALPRMAPYLGLVRVEPARRAERGTGPYAGVFPAQPVVSSTSWERIVQFYSNAAPAHVRDQTRRHQPQLGTSLFRPRVFARSDDAPCTSLLQWDATGGRLYVGDAQSRTLKRLDRTGRVLGHLDVESGPVSLIRTREGWLATLVGRILPSDEPAGQVWSLTETETSWDFVKVLRGLRRPVHTAVVDLNRDGRDDLVLACFGNVLGRLAGFERQADGTWRERVLAESSGTVRVVPHDWNGDGWPDLTVLKAQGREGVDLYLSEVDGSFRIETALEHPPSFGHAAMELVDFQRDGVPELVLVNGDNGDYPSEPKGYHGVRIYERGIDRRFRERYFFPLHGAYGVRAADFDGDGDVDLAAIAFFPDYERAPAENFVFLRNEGEWDFHPFVIPDTQQGRWLVMDAGDPDGDGDIDIWLGSFVRGPRTIPLPSEWARRWESDKAAVMLLENTTR